MGNIEDSKQIFQAHLKSGWHGIEDNGIMAWVWSQEKAEVEIPEGAVYLDLCFDSMYFELTGTIQNIRVFVDEKLWSEHKVKSGSHKIQVICNQNKRIIVECDTVRPCEYTKSKDSRNLGIRLYQLLPIYEDTTFEEYLDKSLCFLDSMLNLKQAYLYTHLHKIEEGEFIHNKVANITQTHPLTVLDCGIGAGGVAIAFAQKGANVTGLDISHWFLCSSRVNAYLAGADIKLVRGDAQNLCFGDECFDVVFGVDIMEHVRHPDVMLREIARVLKQDGIFIFKTGYSFNPANIRKDPHYQTPLIILLPRFLRKYIIVKIRKIAQDIEDFKWFKTYGSLRRFASKCGLEVNLLEPEKVDHAINTAYQSKDTKAIIKRILHFLLPKGTFQNLYATCKECYCIARRRNKH